MRCRVHSLYSPRGDDERVSGGRSLCRGVAAFIVLVAFLQSVHQAMQIVFVTMQVSVSMVKLMFCSQVPPFLEYLCWSRPVPDLFHLIFPLRRWAPIHNTWSAVWTTLGSGFSGNAARERPMIAENCVCAPSVNTVINITTLHA